MFGWGWLPPPQHVSRALLVSCWFLFPKHAFTSSASKSPPLPRGESGSYQQIPAGHSWVLHLIARGKSLRINSIHWVSRLQMVLLGSQTSGSGIWFLLQLLACHSHWGTNNDPCLPTYSCLGSCLFVSKEHASQMPWITLQFCRLSLPLALVRSLQPYWCFFVQNVI